MTALIPTAIDFDGFGTGHVNQAAVVGPALQWASDDGDSSYIVFVPFESNDARVDLTVPPGLPEAWFYEPVYDITHRRAGSAAENMRVVLYGINPAGAGIGFSFVRDFTLAPAYVTDRFTETAADPVFAAAAWALYSAGSTRIYFQVTTSSGSTPGVHTVGDPSIVSARVTYMGAITDVVVPPDLTRTPLRGRQRGSGVSGSAPMRGRNTTPYGLRGRQDSNF